MPELPEVETIVQNLSSKIRGAEVSSFRLFFPGLIRNKKKKILEKLRGRKIINIRRRGKLILIDFDNDLTLLVHLKMTGQFVFYPSHESVDKHTHFILSFKGQKQEVRFRDVRKFGFIQCLLTSEALKLINLGPEPLEISFSSFQNLFKGRQACLKSLILNQNFIAGIGNIYANEILFEAKLHPINSVSLLKEEELKRLWKAMRLVLKRALKHRGSSIRDFKDAEGRVGSFQNFHQVYGKESLPCPHCGARIERLRIGGRSSFFCPQCQREKSKILIEP